MSSECEICGANRLWGGMSWVPHDDKLHEVTRSLLLRHLRKRLEERIATEFGHTVTVYFMGRAAQSRCSCKWESLVTDATWSAGELGHAHLQGEGRRIANMSH